MQAHPETAAPRVRPPLPKTREEAHADPVRGDLYVPKLAPGDPAIDFTLPLLDPNRGTTEQGVRLSDHLGRRPIALIFGSYT